jgi:uncharacterized repeat protein (TIGR01451 family)
MMQKKGTGTFFGPADLWLFRAPRAEKGACPLFLLLAKGGRCLLSHVLALLMLCPSITPAQHPLPAIPAQAPLLFVQMSGPAGMRVTFFRGGSIYALAAPFTVGLRPGYIYRVELNGLPGGQSFYPTLEVRGAVQFPPAMRAVNYPVPVAFSEEDFRAAASGALITRYYILERQDVAIPEATSPRQPIVLSAISEQAAEEMAREHGRTLLVVRLGQRQISPDELAKEGIPGTILCPGEASLPPARDLPHLPWTCASCEPPVRPAGSPEEICIPDGGDFGLQAGIDPQGRLRGLDPGDAVAQYADSLGRPHISVTNRVCICVPRYLVIRTEIVPAAELALVSPLNVRVANGFGFVLARVPSIVEEQVESFAALLARQRLSTTVFVTGPVVIGRVEGVVVVSSEVAPGSVTGECVKPVHVPERPLVIIKWPDKCDAQIGDVITFYLRYSNQGGKPITDIIVSDSLAARFEYVPGSARSDRDAVFTILPNEAESSILRWQIGDPLPGGRSGMVSFQVRIR